jgi:hypothetical protein
MGNWTKNIIFSTEFLVICRKEAQKCFCEAAICRGWLGEQPEDDDDEEEEEEEEEEEYVEENEEQIKDEAEEKADENVEKLDTELKETKTVEEIEKPAKKEKKKRSPRKKPRKDIFEDLDVILFPFISYFIGLLCLFYLATG